MNLTAASEQPIRSIARRHAAPKRSDKAVRLSPVHVPNRSGDDRDKGEVTIRAAFTAPYPAPDQARFPEGVLGAKERFSETAGPVLLNVEVRDDGTAGDVEISRSCGNTSIDASAISYARSLQWIPGTIGSHPATMKIQFEVRVQLLQTGT